MNYRQSIRQELAAQYSAKGFSQRGQRVDTDRRSTTHVSSSSSAWATARDTEPTSYEEQEAAFWSDSSDDDDMYACMF